MELFYLEIPDEILRGKGLRRQLCEPVAKDVATRVPIARNRHNGVLHWVRTIGSASKRSPQSCVQRRTPVIGGPDVDYTAKHGSCASTI